mmetsp:Transcript_7597/g.20599  ORF Transcript_7597/g.20599 Transcript_7597/m.20599 type:complete len:208 (-) Transcript_7597:58-681(-)
MHCFNTPLQQWQLAVAPGLFQKEGMLEPACHHNALQSRSTFQILSNIGRVLVELSAELLVETLVALVDGGDIGLVEFQAALGGGGAALVDATVHLLGQTACSGAFLRVATRQRRCAAQGGIKCVCGGCGHGCCVVGVGVVDDGLHVALVVAMLPLGVVIVVDVELVLHHLFLRVICLVLWCCWSCGDNCGCGSIDGWEHELDQSEDE